MQSTLLFEKTSWFWSSRTKRTNPSRLKIAISQVPALFELDEQVVSGRHVGHDAQPAAALVRKLCQSHEPEGSRILSFIYAGDWPAVGPRWRKATSA